MAAIQELRTTREGKLELIKEVLLQNYDESQEAEKQEFVAFMNHLDDETLEQLYLEAVELSQDRIPYQERRSVIDLRSKTKDLIKAVLENRSFVYENGGINPLFLSCKNKLKRMLEVMQADPGTLGEIDEKVIVAVIKSLSFSDAELAEFVNKAQRFVSNLEIAEESWYQLNQQAAKIEAVLSDPLGAREP